MADVRALREENLRLHHGPRPDAGTGLADRRALSEVSRVRVGGDGSGWSACAAILIDLDLFGGFHRRHGDAA
jgi:GGDEF domain-containing protein